MQHLDVKLTCKQGKKDEDFFAWNKCIPRIIKLLEQGATSGKFTEYASVGDYGGGSETYEYRVEWILEDK